LTRQLDAALREEHELTLNEYEVLLHLWLEEESKLRRVDLADRMLITQGGITRLLATLEERGLVERAPCPTDARVVYACLTRSGTRRIEAARRSHLADVRRLFAARFSEAEIQAFAGLMGRLRESLEAEPG
jgi:DNA-binding MarR family transcriptional regulator